MKRKNQELWTEYESHCFNQGLSQVRVDKLSSLYNTVHRGLDLKTATENDIKQFVDSLHRDTLKKESGKPFSGSTKSDLKKFIKAWYKHFEGNDLVFPPKVSWIKGCVRKEEKPKQKDTITKEEAITLAKSFNKIEHRILTLALFDSGFRIAEMMSVRKQDITFEDYDTDGNQCFWFECRESKTFPRKVPLSLFTEEYAMLFNSNLFQALAPGDLVFGSIKYDYYRILLKKKSQEVLGKTVTCHGLRHSSLTLWADLLNGDLFSLCERAGWSYSTEQASTYIRRSSNRLKLGAHKSFENENTKLKRDMKQIKHDLAKVLRLWDILQGIEQGQTEDIPFYKQLKHEVKQDLSLREVEPVPQPSL